MSQPPPDGLSGSTFGQRPQLSSEELATLLPVAPGESYPAGAVIVRSGDPGDSMFVIEEGEVVILFDDIKEGKRLATGEFFGELALIRGEHRRTASAIAGTECRLRRLDPEIFDRLRISHPELLITLLRRSCTYLVDSEQQLIRDLQRRNRELEQTIDFLDRTRKALDLQEMLAQTDELTGIYNRRCLNTQAASLLASPQPGDCDLALVLVDVDRFKWINDTYGHAAGDRVLITCAERLKRAVRATDFPCRIGGDEFAVLLTHLGEEDAVTRARLLLASLGRFTVPFADDALKVTCSLGGAMRQPPEDWSELQQRADRSLYLAKGAGRGRLGWGGRILDPAG